MFIKRMSVLAMRIMEWSVMNHQMTAGAMNSHCESDARRNHELVCIMCFNEEVPRNMEVEDV